MKIKDVPPLPTADQERARAFIEGEMKAKVKDTADNGVVLELQYVGGENGETKANEDVWPNKSGVKSFANVGVGNIAGNKNIATWLGKVSAGVDITA